MKYFSLLAVFVLTLVVTSFSYSEVVVNGETFIKSWCDDGEGTPKDKSCCNALEQGINKWCASNKGKDACTQCLAQCKASAACKTGIPKGDLELYCQGLCMWKWCGDGGSPGYVCPKVKPVEAAIPQPY
jgi:hypothetical protein